MLWLATGVSLGNLLHRLLSLFDWTRPFCGWYSLLIPWVRCSALMGQVDLGWGLFSLASLEGGKYSACQVAIVFNIIWCWVSEVSKKLFIQSLWNDGGCKERNHILVVDQPCVHLTSEICFRGVQKYKKSDADNFGEVWLIRWNCMGEPAKKYADVSTHAWPTLITPI